LDMKHCAQNVWMVKPVASNQGRGIELYSQLNEVLAHVQYVACCARSGVCPSLVLAPQVCRQREVGRAEVH